MNKVTALLLLASLGMTAVASAQGVYKYVKDGKVIYSDQPPPNAAVTKIEAYSSSNPVSQPAKETEVGDPGLNALRTKECQKAQERLKQYQDSPTLIQRNLKGEEQTLSADDRIAVIMRAQTDVNDLCDPPKEAAQEDDGLTDLTTEVETLN